MAREVITLGSWILGENDAYLVLVKVGVVVTILTKIATNIFD
jgi:hypothetical protein